MNMKTLANKIFYIFLACTLAFGGCANIYEDTFEELKLDYTTFNLKQEGGEFAFMVYYDGDWTISLDKEVDWLELEKTSGKGITPVHIKFQENHLFQRTVNMTINGGGESKVIAITQKPAVATPIISFVEEGINLTNGAYRVKTQMKSNLSEIAIQSQQPTVSYDLGGEGWISNFVVEKMGDDYVVENGTAVYTYYIKFDITANQTGEERVATLSYILSDEEGNEYGHEVLIMQSTEDGKLIITENTIRGCKAKEYSEEISGGLERFDEDIVVEISDNDFIESAYVKDGRLYYTLTENTGTERRQAQITLTIEGSEASATITITQTEAGINAIYEISKPEDLLAWMKDGNNWSGEDLVMLLDNIDCAGVITSSNWSLMDFSGTFDGNNKTIDNFKIQKTGKVAFFNSIKENAIVKNLTFGSGCEVSTTEASTKVSAAMLATLVTGNATLENIVNYGKVTAGGSAAGSSNGTYLGGIATEFTSYGSATNCKNYGDITFCATIKPAKWTSLGGVFGQVARQTDKETEIKRNIIGCENYGTVKFDGVSNNKQSINIGGVIGGGSCALFQECKNFGTVLCETDEAADGGTNIGGIIGLSNADLCGMIKDCVNGRQGDATAGQLINRGATTGEIRMGGAIAFVQNVAVTIEGCKNYGKITNEFETTAALTVGGVAGRILGKATENSISDCHNYGAVSAKSIAGDKKGGVGGILGVFYADNTSGIAQSVINLTSCSNNANVTLDGIGAGNCHVGGIAGGIVDGNATGSITGCTNNGDVRNGTTESTYTGKWIYTGGIIGQYGFATGKISGCTNTGTVINGVHSSATGGNIRIGGVAGNADCATFENNTNSGTVKDVSLSYSIDMGGILGRFNCGSASTMTNCNNTGNIVSENKFSGTASNAFVSMGGIIGRTTKTTLAMVNCSNNCTLENNNTALQNEIMGGILGYGASKISISNCSSKAVIINANAAAIRSGVFGGAWVAEFTVAGCSAGGKYADTVLNSGNYKDFCYGSGSTFKDTANISFAE